MLSFPSFSEAYVEEEDELEEVGSGDELEPDPLSNDENEELEDIQTLIDNHKSRTTNVSGGTAKSKDMQREVVDDFIRNFLEKNNMTRTLEHFQAEWYELQQSGKHPPSSWASKTHEPAHRQTVAWIPA